MCPKYPQGSINCLYMTFPQNWCLVNGMQNNACGRTGEMAQLVEQSQACNPRSWEVLARRLLGAEWSVA